MLMASTSIILLLVVTLVRLAILGLVVYAVMQGIKALKKYNRSEEVRKEKAEVRRSLGEVLKEHRVRCKMTQEFVAESLGVSRQAVSKWETGTADPSTSNLLALAKLFGISAEELLRSVEQEGPEAENGKTT
ncbi:helix-turn-helix domain-containing protein [Neopoerus faecalis]|uniref:helix-turn-helix domain-containing protein n=1 Tax=Neopoerus faecalis TaxID=3032125 RepID=UPI003D9C3EA4